MATSGNPYIKMNPKALYISSTDGEGKELNVTHCSNHVAFGCFSTWKIKDCFRRKKHF